MLFHLLIEKHKKVVIPINVTSWKSQKINTQQEKPIFYNRKNWFLKNTKKKNTRLSEKLNIRKNFVKNSTTVRIVLPFNKDQDSKFSAQKTLRPNGEDSTGVR